LSTAIMGGSNESIFTTMLLSGTGSPPLSVCGGFVSTLKGLAVVRVLLVVVLVLRAGAFVAVVFASEVVGAVEGRMPSLYSLWSERAWMYSFSLTTVSGHTCHRRGLCGQMPSSKMTERGVSLGTPVLAQCQHQANISACRASWQDRLRTFQSRPRIVRLDRRARVLSLYRLPQLACSRVPPWKAC
jgi:hypothetical protein